MLAALVPLVIGSAEAADLPIGFYTDVTGTLRLGITIGIGTGAPKLYMLDTGSNSFNFAYNPSWVPPPSSTIVSNVPYLYGDGTYGFLLSQGAYPSLTYYDTTGTKVAYTQSASASNFQMSQGVYITTGGTGPALYTNSSGVSFYEGTAWSNALAAGTAPMLGTFYGIFGIGPFVTQQGSAIASNVLAQGLGSASVGGATPGGYIVAANGPTGAGLPCSPCVIYGLTPELRAQFTTLIPWTTQGPSVPVSGANSTAEFGLMFSYSLSAPNIATVTWTYGTLLDTGTGVFNLKSNQSVAAYLVPGSTLVTSGSTLTITPTTPGAAALTVTPQPSGPNQVWISVPSNTDIGSVLGISFFQQNSVLFDMDNGLTGYTSNFVTDIPVTAPWTVGPSLGPIGMAGVVSGAGPLAVLSGGSLTLSAANTYTGATSVAANGVLALAGPGSIATSSGVTVDGTLDISRSSAGAAITTLSGSGTVALGGQSLTITAGSGVFAGSLTDGGIGGGSTGGLIIAGGTETLTGTSTYTGGTAVGQNATLVLTGTIAGHLANQGTVSNTGTIGGSVFNYGSMANNGVIGGSVQNVGLLTGNGRIAGVLVVNGTVAPGNSIGRMTVDGSVFFQAGSTYQAEIGAAGSSDLIVSHGSIAVDGGILSLQPVAGFTPTLGATYTLLTADRGISGAFTLDTTYLGAAGSVLPFLGAAVTTGGTSSSLTLVRSSVPYAALAQTPNQANVATAADSLGTSAPLTGILVALTGGAAPAAFTALSGDIYASTQSVLQAQSSYVREAVNGRLRQATGRATDIGPRNAAMGQGDMVLWGQAYGGWGHLSGSSNTAAMDSSIGGFLMGLDGAAADWRIGLAAGYSQSDFSPNSGLASGSADTYDLAVYGGRSFASGGPGTWSLRLGAAYSWHDLQMQRTVALPGLVQAFAPGYAAQTAQAFGELAYAMALGAGPAPVTLEPFANLAYVSVTTNGFSEGAGAAALSARSSQSGILNSRLGVRTEVPLPVIAGVPTTASASLAWQHAVGDLTPQSTLSFTSGSLPFTVAGAPLAADAVVVGAGLSGRLGEAVEVSLSYAGQWAANANENAVKGALIWRF